RSGVCRHLPQLRLGNQALLSSPFPSQVLQREEAMRFDCQGIRAVVVGFFILTPVSQGKAADEWASRSVGVMTMNMYVGTDVNTLLLPLSLPALERAITRAYENILDTRP